MVKWDEPDKKRDWKREPGRERERETQGNWWYSAYAAEKTITSNFFLFCPLPPAFGLSFLFSLWLSRISRYCSPILHSPSLSCNIFTITVVFTVLCSIPLDGWWCIDDDDDEDICYIKKLRYKYANNRCCILSSGHIKFTRFKAVKPLKFA